MDDPCQPLYGGHDCEFVDEVPEHLTCIVCLGAFKEPHLLSCCGKKVCYTCITLIKNSGQACPHCREQHFVTLLDKDFNRQVLNLQVYCSKKPSGCGWTGDLRQLERHLGVCQFVEVSCRWECGLKLPREKIGEHEEDECPLRPYEVKMKRAIDKMEARIGKLELVCENQKKEIGHLKDELKEEQERHEKEKKELKERMDEQQEEMKKLLHEIDQKRTQDLHKVNNSIDEQQKQLDVFKTRVVADMKEHDRHIDEKAEESKHHCNQLRTTLDGKIAAMERNTDEKIGVITRQLEQVNKETGEKFATKESLRTLQGTVVS